MSMQRPINGGRRVRYAPPQRMSIQAALSWAFVSECAGIDFDKFGASEFERVGIDPLWRAAQIAILGTAVDGGGSSDPAHDAQIIASFVEQLPEEFGGRRMALQIVELARARKAPEWGQGARMACVPADGFEMCERNIFLIAHVVKEGGSVWWWKTNQRKWRKRRGDMCRVEYTGTAASITAARQNYHAWATALAYLQVQLAGKLAIEITDEWPEFSPWETSK